MKRWLLFLLLCAVSAGAQLEINEVMYDPGQCADAVCEWVELYNNASTSLNLSNCTLEGKSLSGVIPSYGFLVAVRNQDNFTAAFGLVANIVEISFSLSNGGDIIHLDGGVDCNETFTYTPFVRFGAGNNRTLERTEEGEWGESLVAGGTPGRENSIWRFSQDYSVLEITEILPDPFGEDDADKPSGEWVEIYNAGKKALDLKGLVIKDRHEARIYIAMNTVLGSTVLQPSSYLVVYPNRNHDFDLNNYGYEEVRLFQNTTLIDLVPYFDSTEGMSWSKVQGDWYATLPTPGAENVYREACDWRLLIEMNNSIFRGGDLQFRLIAERLAGFRQNITVRGQIEDIFGVRIAEYSPWTNQAVTTSVSQSYSPNLKEGVYQFNFWFSNLSCNEYVPGDNTVTKLIAINPQYNKKDSSLNIERLYMGNDNEVEWGDQFTTKLNIYKGEETKYSIDLYAEKDGEKISKTTSFNIYEEFRNYTLTLPVQLLANCNEKISSGTATLVLEGLGLQAEKSFEVSGVDEEVCKDYLDYIEDVEKETTELTPSYQIVELPDTVPRGGAFRIKVQLLNDDQPRDYQVWSYVYRGNKCYSCASGTGEREANAQRVHLQEQELQQLDFLLKVDDDTAEGEYKLKVKIKKGEQKTEKELTASLYVLENSPTSLVANTSAQELAFLADTEENASFSGISAEKKQLLGTIQGLVVYESNTEKAKKILPFIVLVSLLLVVAILLKKG